jgi:hypothetical protein
MVDKKAKIWVENNKWFGKKNFKSRPKRRRTVELTPTQIEIARKLKVPLKAYTNQLNRVEW